jgi:hypothetical protein
MIHLPEATPSHVVKRLVEFSIKQWTECFYTFSKNAQKVKCVYLPSVLKLPQPNPVTGTD